MSTHEYTVGVQQGLLKDSNMVKETICRPGNLGSAGLPKLGTPPLTAVAIVVARKRVSRAAAAPAAQASAGAAAAAACVRCVPLLQLQKQQQQRRPLAALKGRRQRRVQQPAAADAVSEKGSRVQGFAFIEPRVVSHSALAPQTSCF
jgi:hypothetical protein